MTTPRGAPGIGAGGGGRGSTSQRRRQGRRQIPATPAGPQRPRGSPATPACHRGPPWSAVLRQLRRHSPGAEVPSPGSGPQRPQVLVFAWALATPHATGPNTLEVLGRPSDSDRGRRGRAPPPRRGGLRQRRRWLRGPTEDIPAAAAARGPRRSEFVILTWNSNICLMIFVILLCND